MKVALIRPPTIQTVTRGTGVYVNQLTQHLAQISGIESELIDFNFWRNDYSKYDLVHFLYFDAFFLTLCPLRNRPTIVTLMDLTPIVLSDLYPKGINGSLKWQIQKFLVAHVDRIITLSENSKKDIQKTLSIPSSKISPIYLAADEFSPSQDKRKIQKTKEKYSLPDNYICYLGDINANKNIGSLIKALGLMPSEKRPVLLFSGKAVLNENLPESQEIHALIKLNNLDGFIRMPGFVSDEDIQDLFTEARALVHPALYEGFGLPVLQAMSCGCPVICGHNSSLPEVAGDAAIYADVASPQALANKIKEVVDYSLKDRKTVAEKSINQASKFTWSKTAQQTYATYQKVLA